ncbi:hypothetical protein ACFX2B_014403 [Malus domestica]
MEDETAANAAARLAAHEPTDEETVRVETTYVTDDLGRPIEFAECEEKPGVLESMIKAVTGTLEHAKEVVVGKPHEESQKAKEKKEAAKGKVVEYADYTAQKETKDTATQKANEAKDTTMWKAGEYTNYAAEKARETKDTAAQKAKEAKDTTMGKAGEYTKLQTMLLRRQERPRTP